MNWIGGIAKGLVKHGVDNGLDAWRKLYHKYVLLAGDLQNLSIQESMSLKTATEREIDKLFNDVECIRDSYIKAGTDTEDLSERWIRAAVLRNLPDPILKIHAVDLKKAESIEEMQSIINTYQFDHKTSLPRGQQGPGLYSTEADAKEDDKETRDSTKTSAEWNRRIGSGGPGHPEIGGADTAGTRDSGADGGVYIQCQKELVKANAEKEGNRDTGNVGIVESGSIPEENAQS